MKQVNKMSRLTGQLEKIFRMLNEDLFNGELPTPIITVIPTSRAYAHYTPWDAWTSKDEYKREINISSAYLARPLEEVIASLLHEMVHMYNDCVLNVQDTSNKGVYHNKNFKREAETHGLIVTRSEKYGYSHTAPSDMLIEWILNHDELREIELCRVIPGNVLVGVGTKTGNGDGVQVKPTSNSHHRKYICPRCGNSCRATKQINLICGDCLERMIEA